MRLKNMRIGGIPFCLNKPVSVEQRNLEYNNYTCWQHQRISYIYYIVVDVRWKVGKGM